MVTNGGGTTNITRHRKESDIWDMNLIIRPCTLSGALDYTCTLLETARSTCTLLRTLLSVETLVETLVRTGD